MDGSTSVYTGFTFDSDEPATFYCGWEVADEVIPSKECGYGTTVHPYLAVDDLTEDTPMVLHLRAVDASGNVSTADVHWTLDR